MSSTGDQTPMLAYVGSRPMRVVDAPMQRSVTMRTVRRPMRSP